MNSHLDKNHSSANFSFQSWSRYFLFLLLLHVEPTLDSHRTAWKSKLDKTNIFFLLLPSTFPGLHVTYCYYNATYYSSLLCIFSSCSDSGKACYSVLLYFLFPRSLQKQEDKKIDKRKVKILKNIQKKIFCIFTSQHFLFSFFINSVDNTERIIAVSDFASFL